MMDLALNFDRKRTHFALWKLIVSCSVTAPVQVLTCIIELRCDTKPFDGLLQIDYDFSLSLLRLLNLSSFFCCVSFFVGLSINLFVSVRCKNVAHWLWSREQGVNQINIKHRQILIPSEILAFTINLVLITLPLEASGTKCFNIGHNVTRIYSSGVFFWNCRGKNIFEMFLIQNS